MLYPNNIQKKQKSFVSFANRGMALEGLLNETNQYYEEKGVALIYKKPTPIGISEAVYTPKGRVIKSGYFKAPSTLDYNGVYKGKYIEFEAKECQSKTSFPLSNFHAHQISYIQNVLKHGAICFIIIKMNSMVYLLKGEDFVDFLQNQPRKSIPYSYIQERGYVLKEGYAPSLPYLEVVDQIYLKGEF